MDRISPETRPIVEAALFIVLPLVLSVGLAVELIHGHKMMFDFEREYLPAAHRWLDGRSPYAPNRQSVAAGVAFPYTALALLMLIPFTLLPTAVGGAIFAILAGAAAARTLWVLGARDWRLYGLLFLWPPVITGWTTGNFTLFAILGVAVAWRYRHSHCVVAGICLALACSLKPFLWPVAAVLLAIGCHRPVLWAAGTGALMNLAAFLVVGFGRLGAYVHTSAAVSSHFMDTSYGFAAAASHLGASRPLALAITFVSAGLVAFVGVLLSRRQGRSAAPALVAATLLASPILWMHYFALLIVPLVLVRPHVDRVWLSGLLLWACPLGAPTPLENFIAICVVCGQMATISRERTVIHPWPRPTRFGSLRSPAARSRR